MIRVRRPIGASRIRFRNPHIMVSKRRFVAKSDPAGAKIHSERAPDPFLVSAKPPEFWISLENQRRFWHLLALHLKNDPNDLHKWYNYTISGLSKYLSVRLDWIHRIHKANLSIALQAAYPEHNWKPWLFSAVPSGYWDDPATHRLYFDWLRDRLHIPLTELQKFYDVPLDVVFQNRGRALVRTYYGSSLATALKAIYSEHRWEVWRFSRSRVPRNFWADPAGQRQYFEALTKELSGLSADSALNLSVWYQWTAKSLEKVRPESACVVRAYFGGNLPSALQSAFPEHNWDATQFKRSTREVNKPA